MFTEIQQKHIWPFSDDESDHRHKQEGRRHEHHRHRREHRGHHHEQHAMIFMCRGWFYGSQLSSQMRKEALFFQTPKNGKYFLSRDHVF
mgnify:CR=1 FL=1